MSSASEIITDNLHQALKRMNDLTNYDWWMRPSILELREANYQWRQMEWVGFYFEYLFARAVSSMPEIQIPGQKVCNMRFDAFSMVNLDLKAHTNGTSAIIILNDRVAIEQAITLHGALGFLVINGDVQYDQDGSDRLWHNALKGKPSAYVLSNPNRKSRRRKRRFTGCNVQFYYVDNLDQLLLVNQGTNSDGGARNRKYALDTSETPATTSWDIVAGSKSVNSYSLSHAPF